MPTRMGNASDSEPTTCAMLTSLLTWSAENRSLVSARGFSARTLSR